MIEKTYKLHMHQKWAFGESNTIDIRKFYGENEAEIKRQLRKSQEMLFEDSCVLKAWYEEVTE